jgi:hypothetical protein
MIQVSIYNINHIFVILLATFIIVLPASAMTVAMYGTNSGFNPDLHKDTVVVASSIPGSGSDLDSKVDQFTDPSVDVIILGGDDAFSLSTAAKIDTAVAGGKILVITFPCNQQFNASLPAANGGTTTGGQSLELADPTKVITKEIFTGLPSQYPLTGKSQDQEQVVAKKGAVTLLNYDTGTPALLYGKFGKGYVIEWTTVPVPAYMGTNEADTINYRLISQLLPVTSTTTVSTTTVPETTTTTNPLVNATVTITSTGSVSSEQSYGNVTVHSSPSGASILIDGVYGGTTPVTVTNIAQGNHIIRLTLSGYYDYEGTIYVIAGQTASAFGTLPPLNQISTSNTVTPVATPIVVAIPVTAEPTDKGGSLDNSIVVAIIGVVTAIIGATATIFSHISKTKKE